MALNTLKCNHLTPMRLKGLKSHRCSSVANSELSVRVFVCVFRCWSYVGFTGTINQTVSISDGCQSVTDLSMTRSYHVIIADAKFECRVHSKTRL